ncbi:hypothetical protein G9A89_012639 [Geosiphon pyriformis]|nr:hypothetical protein G9A89_012639 [Geosiphon pyriformis]
MATTSSLTYTKVEEMEQIVSTLRQTFFQNITKPLAYRKQQLQQLYLLIDENEPAIFEALRQDLYKPRNEAWLGETVLLKQEILDMLKNLDQWAAPEVVKRPLGYALNKCYIRKEPIGNVLIISSWNYPVVLLLGPLVGAIGAGCTAICKPSEMAVHVALLLSELFPKYLDPNAYALVQGGPNETTFLLENKFDHIFYTGSTAVGKIIMAAAAKNLTRITLELGGKSPVILTKNTDIVISVKRILWGKLYNCGQTCIAPDYVLCEESVQAAILEQIPIALREMQGNDVQQSEGYARIINHRHFDRLTNLLQRTKGRIVIGGESDRDNLFIAPTIVADVTSDDILMQEEIFGPILPIIVVKNLEEAIKFVNNLPEPLCLYPFSKDKKTIQYVLDNTRSGGASINDCMLHFAVNTLPFGGIGSSGMGSYHGKRSFDVFSHERSTLETPFYAERLLKARYPPYTQKKMKVLGWLLVSTPSFVKKSGGNIHFGNKSKTGFLITIVAISAYLFINAKFMN